MTIKKEELEEILDKLVSKESRQTFFEQAIANQRLDCQSVPDKYIDDVLEMEPSTAQISTNGGPYREDPKREIQLKFMAELAEHAERYETAANLYRQLEHTKKAVECAEKAGLTDLADKWAEEYVQKAYTEDREVSSLRNSALNYQVIGAIHRAEWLGRKDMALKIAANYLASFTHDKLNKFSRRERAELCEELGEFAKEHGPGQSESERFYRKAMHQFEEIGEYDCALRVARTLEDPEKIKFYDNLRFLVADPARRKQIEQDRADDEDGKEFERPK